MTPARIHADRLLAALGFVPSGSPRATRHPGLEPGSSCLFPAEEAGPWIRSGATGAAAGTDHPALAWRRAGLMTVTGRPDGPGLMGPAMLAAAADGALLALKALVPHAPLPLNGALLLGERARLLGLSRGGTVSANRSCALLDTADGRIALNLARPDDRALLPILLEVAEDADWPAIAHAAATRDTAGLMGLGIELGLPIAQDMPATPRDPFRITDARSAPRRATRRPLVLDFGALWAGPLAGSLLAMAGADVVKVESVRRPDGARRGHAGFYALLNAAKRSVAVDFADPAARARLRALVDRADIVIEASRPHALARLGIDRDAMVARGGIWIAITAHDDPDRVGFGDDAAVEGGLADAMRRGWGQAMFAGDAIADPLTGLHAALAAQALWHGQRAGLVHLSLAGVTAACLATRDEGGDDLAAWQEVAEADDAPLYPLRRATGAARAMGSDNALLLSAS